MLHIEENDFEICNLYSCEKQSLWLEIWSGAKSKKI